MTRDDGGSAFPLADERDPNGCGIRQGSPGMSLRDWFAGNIIQGMIAGEATYGGDDGLLRTAKEAYQIADAMLKARVASAETQP